MHAPTKDMKYQFHENTSEEGEMQGARYTEERGDASEVERLAKAATNLLYSGNKMDISALELYFEGQ